MALSILTVVLTAVVSEVIALGIPSGPGGNVGEYGPPNAPPKPYAFNYQVKDELGNTHFRHEQGDHLGTVSGSYGYNHVNGLYRTVEYVADAGGFRARVKSNEPGVGPGSADVHVEAEPVPPTVHLGPGPSVPGPVPGVVKPAYGGKKG